MGGSKNSASGVRRRPPAVNCHAVNVRSDTGGRHFRVRTVPKAMEAAPMNPAATPIGSSVAFGVKTKSATPAIPTRAATIDMGRMARDSRTAARKTTTKGWISPTVAATPPGRR